MPEPTPLSRFRLAAIAALCFGGGAFGTFIGRIYGTALGTTPAWVGPVILIGALALFVIGLLLLPAAIRALRAGRSAP